jgi:hypothetical protein
MAQTHFLPIEEPNVWSGRDFSTDEEWVINLSKTHISVLEFAMTNAMDQNIAPPDLTPDNFWLGELCPFLDTAYETLEHGRGFLVLRGWPSENYSHAQNLTVFCGVASYFGKAMVQNFEGEAVVDVIDKEKPYDHTSRGYMSNKGLPFHTDGADLVGLLCLGEPIKGGTSLLLSATKLFQHHSCRTSRVYGYSDARVLSPSARTARPGRGTGIRQTYSDFQFPQRPVALLLQSQSHRLGYP